MPNTSVCSSCPDMMTDMSIETGKSGEAVICPSVSARGCLTRGQLSAPCLTKMFYTCIVFPVRWSNEDGWQAGHVACVRNIKNACKILIGKPEGKRSFGRPRYVWEHNTKMCHTKTMGRWWACVFNWLVEWLMASQEKFCSMELVKSTIIKATKCCIFIVCSWQSLIINVMYC